jgi:Uroporphyrinogen-III decarboxylase
MILMTSRERFLKVIRGEIPDRAPVTLFIQDQGHFLSQMYPEVDPWDYTALQLKVIEIQKQLGVDVFVRLLFGINDPLHIHMGGLDVSQQNENWEVHTEEVSRGETLIKRSVIKTPAGVLTQDFSIHRLRKGTYVYACTKKPITNPDELEIAIKYEPRMPQSFKTQVKQRMAVIKNALGEDGIIGVWAPHGPFNNASLLINHDELYSLFLTDYDYYERLMNFAMERILDYTEAIDAAGPDVLCVGGNVPGGFLGKRCYDEYILPFEKRYIEFCQKNGTPAMYHNCGQIMNLVESYKELGCKMVEPFSPAPLGDADLAKAKALVNGAYVMIGGVDQVNVLQNGSVEQVKQVTANTMRTGKPGGKFILQSADFLEYGTPLENLEAYVKTALENAGYESNA